MLRRNFLEATSLAGVAGLVGMGSDKVEASKAVATGSDDRRYWVELLDKIATPVLDNMSRGMLQKNMAVDVSPIWDNRDRRVAYMEAFGRLAAGLGPLRSL